MEQNLLVVVSVIFALSLLGAFVLFKFLKSAAMIKRPGYQAGGALAGFLLIFGTLYMSYNQLEANAAGRAAAVALWTVLGEVRLEGDDKDSAEVEVSFMPPHHKTLSQQGGSFRFDEIGLSSDGTVELQFAVVGYSTKTLLIDAGVAEINSDSKRITLKEPVLLTPLGRRTLPSSADLGNLSGKVLKFIRERSPLSGARLELLATGTDEVQYRTFSDREGDYSFRGIEPGEYEIRVRLGRQSLDLMFPNPPLVDIQAGEDLTRIVTIRMQG